VTGNSEDIELTSTNLGECVGLYATNWASTKVISSIRFATGDFIFAQEWFRLRFWNAREREEPSVFSHGHCISSAYVSWVLMSSASKGPRIYASAALHRS